MQSFLAATYGSVPALTPTALIDPMTGNNAVVPANSCVASVLIYRDGNSPVTADCNIRLGTQSDGTRFINDTDSFTTTKLNTSTVLYKGMTTDEGSDAAESVYVELSNELSLGAVYFQVFYLGLDTSQSQMLMSESTTETLKLRGNSK